MRRYTIYFFILLCNALAIGMEKTKFPTIHQLMKAVESNDPILTHEIVTAHPHLINQEFPYKLVSPFESEDIQITPLHIAREQCAKVLIKNNAQVNARTSTGETPLDFVLLKSDYYDKELALYYIRCGADINNVDNQGNSLLHRIIMSNNNTLPCSTIPLLLQHNVDTEKRNRQEQTPIDLAIVKRFPLLYMFEKVGILFFYSDGQDINPYDLLKRDAYEFKYRKHTTIPQERDRNTIMEYRLANLFIFVERWSKKNKLTLESSHQTSPSHHGIIINEYGYCFKKTTLQDLRAWVGSTYTIEEHFKKRCEEALKILKESPEHFLKIVHIYPYVVNYHPCYYSAPLFEYMIKTMKNEEHKGFITIILEYVQNINFTNAFGRTLLHLAEENDNPLFAKLLIEKGIDTTIKAPERKYYPPCDWW